MIEIVPYRESWPEAFQKIGDEIRSVLGDSALAIHHIGSTSILGMPAKNVIDVQITVDDLDRSLEEPMKTLGYELTGYVKDHPPFGLQCSEWDMEKRYYRSSGHTHIHVRSLGRLNQKYALVCRDYLRTHPMAASGYAEIKLQLAKRFADDVDSYYDIKDPVFDVILSGGFEWAEWTSWTQPPTDA